MSQTNVIYNNDSALADANSRKLSSVLSGDVTGSTSSTVVSRVGTFNVTQINTAITMVNNATYNNAANTIIMRDSNGDFSAGNSTLVSIIVTGNTTLGNNANDSITVNGKLASNVDLNNNSLNNIGNLTVNGSTLLGDNANDTIGFFGKTPVVRQTCNDITSLLTALNSMGLILRA